MGQCQIKYVITHFNNASQANSLYFSFECLSATEEGMRQAAGEPARCALILVVERAIVLEIIFRSEIRLSVVVRQVICLAFPVRTQNSEIAENALDLF